MAVLFSLLSISVSLRFRLTLTPRLPRPGFSVLQEELGQVLDRVRRSVGADGIEGGQEMRDHQLVQVLLAGQALGLHHALRLLNPTL